MIGGFSATVATASLRGQSAPKPLCAVTRHVGVRPARSTAELGASRQTRAWGFWSWSPPSESVQLCDAHVAVPEVA